MIHRNLKPDNILFNKSELLILTDFSISRRKVTPEFVYTPEDPKERESSGRKTRQLWYKAPEMLLRRSKYSEEIDMWSVGCIFAELATCAPLLTCSQKFISSSKFIVSLGLQAL
jgi:serine/threonine protein kinase